MLPRASFKSGQKWPKNNNPDPIFPKFNHNIQHSLCIRDNSSPHPDLRISGCTYKPHSTFWHMHFQLFNRPLKIQYSAICFTLALKSNLDFAQLAFLAFNKGMFQLCLTFWNFLLNNRLVKLTLGWSMGTAQGPNLSVRKLRLRIFHGGGGGEWGWVQSGYPAAEESLWDYAGMYNCDVIHTPYSLDIRLYWAVIMLTFWAAWAEITNQPKSNKLPLILCKTGFYKLPGLL